ncbi:hypothetical protein [uncultured Cohaesibacter sp.]|uniref:hypothetical protein n=1 Tax=uncultured Cohaesibacter sp. TaxID=1002546 RepID=UPI0029302A01|nr:hypothetical protein [uncultured Cohaesibacter sp.]
MRLFSALLFCCLISTPLLADELEIPIDGAFALERSWVETKEIDPANDTPELLIVDYSGGVHCCSDLTVITKTDKGWKLLSFPFHLDGENFFNDVDDDGIPELLADKVYQVRGGKVYSRPCKDWVEWNDMKYCGG